MNHGVRNGYVLQNIGTGSFVTHTESSFGIEPVCMIWDDIRKAEAHAKDLFVEYQIAKPAMAVRNRTWRVRRATRDQILKALAVGAYGPEYADKIRSTTSELAGRASDEQAESFREELDRNRRN